MSSRHVSLRETKYRKSRKKTFINLLDDLGTSLLLQPIEFGQQFCCEVIHLLDDIGKVLLLETPSNLTDSHRSCLQKDMLQNSIPKGQVTQANSIVTTILPVVYKRNRHGKYAK